MSKYEKLDAAIIAKIKLGKSPFDGRRPGDGDESCVISQAYLIAQQEDRSTFRVIDGRLTALRKKGKIKHLKKSDTGDFARWVVCSDQQNETK
jgi:hypothetical protein